MEQRYDIFLSYDRDDLPRVRVLVSALERQGWRVWWDRRIRAGRTFDEVIEEALQQSRCVVVVWTSTSAKSHWVRDEAQEGLDRGTLVPVFWEEIRAPLGFRRIQGAQLQNWDGDETAEAFRRLHADLVSLLGEPEEQQVIAPPSVEPKPSLPTRTSRHAHPLSIEFVLIQPGEFHMGADRAQAFDNEKPVHRVRITRPYYLGMYAVTQAQWETVMGNNPSHFQGDPQRPVEQVSWDDAQAFLAKLREREPGMVYRLPTEAEWEYAARAGTTTAYSFGDDAGQLGEYAWYTGNAGGDYACGRAAQAQWLGAL